MKNDTMSDFSRRQRLERAATAVWQLGPRAVYELLSEIGAAHLIQADIETRAASYAAIDPVALKIAGGDKFPPLPLRGIVQC